VSTGAVKSVDHHRRVVAIDQTRIADTVIIDPWSPALDVSEDVWRHLFELCFPTWYRHADILQEKLLE
jgi:hypothetical protein